MFPKISEELPVVCKGTIKPSTKVYLFAFCRGRVFKTRLELVKDQRQTDLIFGTFLPLGWDWNIAPTSVVEISSDVSRFFGSLLRWR